MEPGADWRERITAWAVAFRDAIRRHPWVLQVPIVEPPLSPMQLEWMENGLRAFEETELTAADSLSAMLLVNIYVRGAGAISSNLTPEGSDANQLYVQRLNLLADPDRYPTIAGNLRSRPAEDFDVDYDADDFFFGLNTTLDGIEALITRRNAGRGSDV
ncbi:TetR/AcrR family transcriptional regulator C-terminal domain-containing protein [Streptomyces sp. SID13031]|uniref:TetR/AcrR family transcriptional regulator C-terminal domain-containing protein n=1 Tax=Streptomyces sp. SID13031 TaxID=2706046 RepID=UPI0013C994A5|nr:hypothetical protein [Streptomyces sp. SID13031]